MPVDIKLHNVADRRTQTLTAPADDAASSPHQSDGAVIEDPAELFGCLPQQHEALRVRDDLGGV